MNTHDFPQDALCRAVPYGIYDLQHNRGAVYVGTSADTPQFAVAAIARWWETEGRVAYPGADRGADLCRRRGQQRLPSTSVEACAADPPRGSLRSARDGVSLSHGLLEVEPH